MNSATFSIRTWVCFCVKTAVPALILGLVLCLASSPTFAQGGTASIQGTVTDTTGGPVAGATVSITEIDIGATRTLTTDQSGAYSAPALRPGKKTVRAEFKGFKTAERGNIVLEVGQELRLDFVLQPGEISETVRVEVAAPIVDTTNAEQGGSLSNQVVNDLPLNGRNYQNLLTLRPGVTIYGGGGGWTQSTNGIRPDDNVYTVDGLNQNEPWTGMSIVNGSALAGDVQTFIPLDAIQEFKTAQNTRADAGFKPGSVVNVGLKAGTNELHGTAYAFGRTDAWDAKNYFDTAAQGFPPFNVSLKQFGATARRRDQERQDCFGSWPTRASSTKPPARSLRLRRSPAVQETPGADYPRSWHNGTNLAINNGCANLGPTVVANCNLSIVDSCKDMVAGGLPITALSTTLVGSNPATCAVNANNPGAKNCSRERRGIVPD